MTRARKTWIVPVALLLLLLVLMPQSSHENSLSVQMSLSQINDPLGHFESTGLPASLSWTGDGQRLNNPSFETGTLTPWSQVQYLNASGSTTTIVNSGYSGSKSSQLSIYSGNLSAIALIQSSNVGLVQDLSQQKIAFNTATRFRASVLVEAMTGTNRSDRVEVSLQLTTSTGSVRTIHYVFAVGAGLPGSSATDAYLNVTGSGTSGSWRSIDRNLAADAAITFPAEYPAFDSIQLVTLKTLAQTLPGPPTIDPRIKFSDSAGFGFWASGEQVVYDQDNSGTYNTGDLVIGCGVGNPCPPPPNNAPLTRDSRIKFVDSNNNNVWDCSAQTPPVCTSGESVVDDRNNGPSCRDNIFDFCDTVIAGSTPAFDTLLMKVVQGHTQALFDQMELYTATGGYNWVRNGGFEAGLAGWGTNSSSGFTSTTTPVHSGSRSAKASVLGGAIEMAQSMDARPMLDSTMRFQASANIATLTGASTSDSADLWLGLDDSQGNPLSLYYYFKTGDGTIPTNRTDTVYLKVNGFGGAGWLSIDVGLSQLVQSAVSQNSLAYTAPYTVELVVLEASASPLMTTTTYFDDISLGNPSHNGLASSYFYAVDNLNSTYAYSAASIPQGAFSLDVPVGMALVNVTSPEGSILQPGDYATSMSSGLRRIDVFESAMFKHSPLGDWKIFTTSKNAITSVYAADPATGNQSPSILVGSTVNLVSQSKDPTGVPISGASASLELWLATPGIAKGFWQGNTSGQGWWNTTGVKIPPVGEPAGIYIVQATVSSDYAGLRTFQVSARYTVTLSLSLSSSQASQGDSVSISGTVLLAGTSTPRVGTSVTLSYRQAGNSQWTILGNLTTDSNGRYSYDWRPLQGDYEVMASMGDPQTNPAESTRAQVLVGPPGPLSGLNLIILIVVGIVAAIVIGLFFLKRRGGRPPQLT